MSSPPSFAYSRWHTYSWRRLRYSFAACLISKWILVSCYWGFCIQFYKWSGLMCGSCSNSYWAFYGRAAFHVFIHSDSIRRSVIIPVYRWGGQGTKQFCTCKFVSCRFRYCLIHACRYSALMTHTEPVLEKDQTQWKLSGNLLGRQALWLSTSHHS